MEKNRERLLSFNNLIDKVQCTSSTDSCNKNFSFVFFFNEILSV